MPASNQFSLLKLRRFGPFFLTQFFGAFNDNLFKNALVLLVTFKIVSEADSANTLVNLAAGLFILPFFLFSATAGQLADKLEKSQLIRTIKLLEIGIMLIAAIGFFYSNVHILIGLLFLMGTQSAFFGPVKYGILPQHLHTDELMGGNALVETGTFLAILLGTIGAGFLIGAESASTYIVSICVITVAVFGYAASRWIPLAEPADPDLDMNWNPLTETWRILRFAHSNNTVFQSVLGISWFWFFGATFLTQIPVFTKTSLAGDATVSTLIMTLFAVGIGIGSMLCEKLSGKIIELGLVPFGSIGLTAFGVDLYFAQPHLVDPVIVGAADFLQRPGSVRVIADLLMIGVFGGFFIVPLYALVQKRSEPSRRSRIIAANNILNALFMVLSASLAIVILGAGLSVPELFLITAVMNAAVAVYIYTLVPEFLMRFLVWIVTHTMYRVKKTGLEQIPEEGPAVLVCNHVSFMDALIIGGAVRRPVRFVMYHKIFDVPVLNFIFRTARAIPIAGHKEDPAMLEQAYERIHEELTEGNIVCIFPEGQITRDGEINEFRSGIERIVKRTPVPVIPMALQGMWGSYFSRKHGPAMARLPRRFWSRIGVIIGPQVPAADAKAQVLQERVMDLRGAQK